MLSLTCEVGILICTAVFAVVSQRSGHDDDSREGGEAGSDQSTVAFAFLGVSAVCSVVAFVANVAGARATMTAVRKLSERVRTGSQLVIQVRNPQLCCQWRPSPYNQGKAWPA